MWSSLPGRSVFQAFAGRRRLASCLFMLHGGSPGQGEVPVVITTPDLQLLEPRDAKTPATELQPDGEDWLPDCSSQTAVPVWLLRSATQTTGESGAA